MTNPMKTIAAAPTLSPLVSALAIRAATTICRTGDPMDVAGAALLMSMPSS
jgi:hypothetical protein